MVRLHIMDALMTGVVCAFLFLINRPLVQHIWTLEEVAYFIDTNDVVINRQYIRTVDINQTNAPVKNSGMYSGSSLPSMIQCSTGGGLAGGSLTEDRRLQPLRNAVFWVY